MKKEKRDLIRNIILLSIFILINIFLIIVAQSPQLTEIRQETNLIIRFVFFGVMLLFIAVIHVDYYLRKDKRIYTIMIFSGIALILGITALILM